MKQPHNKINSQTYLSNIENKFGDKYEYHLVEYTSAKDKIKLICKEHGEFSSEASYLLNKSKGCPICTRRILSEAQKDNTEIFIKKKQI